MRRFVSLLILIFFAVPFGISVVGCSHSTPVVYCNGGDSGPVVGQAASITLESALATTGESLSYGQIGQGLSATAIDCKGSPVSVRSYTYATSNMSFADINPSNGSVCAGTWNRNTGGGVPDYTTCTANPNPPGNLAYVTATADGATSNAIPIYVHPLVTSVIIGNPTPTSSCAAALASSTGDPSSNCCPTAVTAPGSPSLYDGNSCLSQGATAQLAARVYANNSTTPANNITCEIGHIGFTAESAPSVVTIDENGVATANQPGSTTITTGIASTGSGSTSGFFSTCPPTSIMLTAPNQPNPISVDVNLNNSQPLTAVATDMNGTILTGLDLEFNSTSVQTIPTSGNSVNPIFPGSATVSAVCQPPACNPSAFSQIGYLGNGTPLTSNGVAVTTAGTSSTVLYVGSTDSQYIYPMDFTTNQPGTLIKLPYVPNSMVITPDGTEIYLGSSQGLMTVSGANSVLSSTNTNIVGTVLSVSPNDATLVVTDPVRQTINLVSSSGTVTATYGGVGTRAQWAPDSQTVYITTATTTGQVLVHSTFTGWTADPTDETYSDVAVTVPAVGAYFAGKSTTEGRTYCPASTVNAPVGLNPPTVTNTFYPLADSEPYPTDRLAATDDGKHILGATVLTTPATLDDLTFTSNGLNATAPCSPTTPTTYSSAVATHPLTGISAAAISGVDPATNSTVAFVTYDPANATPNALLPYYFTASGTVQDIALGNGATTASAPVAGVFSSDNFTFYVGTGTYAAAGASPADTTSADNDVHLLTLTYPSSGSPTVTETGILSPNLPYYGGTGYAPVNLMVQRPKKSTS